MPNTAVVVRRATLADAAGICAVHKLAVRALAEVGYTPDQISGWVDQLQPANHEWAMKHGETVFVAEIDGRMAGFGSLLGDEVRAIYVHPGYAGQAVDSALLATIEDEAVWRDLTTLRVYAALDAVDFYRSHGYAGETRVAVPLPSGTELPSVHMRKTLR